jgi:S-formylglutathione hydrolase FrmB
LKVIGTDIKDQAVQGERHMLNKFTPFLVLVFTLLVVSPVASQNPSPGPLRFRITLSKELATQTSAGRLFVLMSDQAQDQPVLSTGFSPGSTWLAAMEVEAVAPGQTIELNPESLVYPKPFAQARPGSYQFMALLDTDHNYAYNGLGEGDLYSAVIRVDNLNPASTAPVELLLSKRGEARFTPKESENVKLAEFQSPLLTAFWGRPIKMRAGIVLPPSFSKNPKQTYPTVFHIHGFGGNHYGAWRAAAGLTRAMSEGKQMEMMHVFLDGSFPTGHHEFADSVNNGPWGRALTEEFIPYLEKNYRLLAKPYGRFLTGHSSGGWSTLWLQVTYPDFFGGTWSTAPDPVDLRRFTGIDATPNSTDNAYRTNDGKAKNLVLIDGKEVATIEEFAKQEVVQGEYGGQFASFEWVWSPKDKDGRPMKMFNRVTGELDPEVLKAWQNYDIRLILEKNWAKLEPKLRGKVNVICGGADTFHLNEAVVLLCDFLKQKGSDAVCEIVPNRDHGNLFRPYATYPDGLEARIAKEMQAKFEKATQAASAGKAAKSKALR